MDEGKILIVNVSRGRIGEDASRLLGALLVSKIQLAAMSRVDIPESERRDFYLYVDEFQHFATESFANILSEARKFHLSLVMAHQYIKQMAEEVRDAVFGNVGTIVAFRVGAEDGEFLEKWFQPDFMMNDIVNLGKYNVYLKLMIDGVSSKGFSASMMAPLAKLEKSNRDEIIEHSRKTYANPRAEIEKTIADWAVKIDGKEMARPGSSERSSYQQQDRRDDYRSAPRVQTGLPAQAGQADRPRQVFERRPTVEYQQRPEQRYEQRRDEGSYRQPEPRREERPYRPSMQSGSFERPMSRSQEPVRLPVNKPAQAPTVSGTSFKAVTDEGTRTIGLEPRQPLVHNPGPPKITESVPPQRPSLPFHGSKSGLSLDAALQSDPVNFRGKKIEHKRERPKVEVNTDELKKILEEAMKVDK